MYGHFAECGISTPSSLHAFQTAVLRKVLRELATVAVTMGAHELSSAFSDVVPMLTLATGGI